MKFFTPELLKSNHNQLWAKKYQEYAKYVESIKDSIHPSFKSLNDLNLHDEELFDYFEIQSYLFLEVGHYCLCFRNVRRFDLGAITGNEGCWGWAEISPVVKGITRISVLVLSDQMEIFVEAESVDCLHKPRREWIIGASPFRE